MTEPEEGTGRHVGKQSSVRIEGLDLVLPDKGTGARAARRAAREEAEREAAAKASPRPRPRPLSEQRPPTAIEPPAAEPAESEPPPPNRTAPRPVAPAPRPPSPSVPTPRPTSVAAPSAAPRRRAPLVAPPPLPVEPAIEVPPAEPAGGPGRPDGDRPIWPVPEPSDLPPLDEPRLRPSRRWMTGFAAALAAAVLLGGLLTWVGARTLRDSTAGRTVTSTDPSEPGFEGLLEPSPTLLVVHASEGELRSAALLSLRSGDAGGSVVLLPPSVEVGDGAGATPLSVTYAFGGTPDVLRGAGEAIAGVGVQDVVVIDGSRWAELVAPVAPLTLQNPDDVDGFDAGPVTLGPEDVSPWLEARREDETELSALTRQQLFWEAWVAAVAASGDDAAVPGELDSGIGRFVRGLASGQMQVATVPVTEAPAFDDEAPPTYRVDRAALSGIITDLVPFPQGTALAPRTRVRLLDGTGDPDHVTRVAPNVVASDATIVVVGNADAFDYTTTEIRYHHPSQRSAAADLQRALGAGRVVDDVRPIDSFDVTIVLGTDT